MLNRVTPNSPYSNSDVNITSLCEVSYCEIKFHKLNQYHCRLVGVKKNTADLPVLDRRHLWVDIRHEILFLANQTFGL